jgi:hypothetical protein
MSQAALTVTTPGKLIRWHYLWYVAVALVVMVVVIASGHLWSPNFVHVFSGLLWTGIDLFMGFVLGPILRVIDISARKAVLLRLTPRTLFLMPTLSIITGTTIAPRFGAPIQPTRAGPLWAISDRRYALSSTLHILRRVADGIYESLQQDCGNFHVFWV